MATFFARSLKEKIDRQHSFDVMIEAQRAAKSCGHDFGSVEHVNPLDYIQDELREFKEALENPEYANHPRDEFGDVLFNVINLGLACGIEPKEALDAVVKRWLNRKLVQEKKLEEAGYTWCDVPDDLCMDFWRQAKAELKAQERAS